MIKKFLGSARRYLLNRLENPAIVLLYHRVTNLEHDPQLLAVHPDNFYEQINMLKKNYTLLRIDEFSELLLTKKRIPKNTVIITFDDGYADNLYEALPILESLNSQALFYITTSNINTNHELWWDELERIILHGNFSSDKIEIKTGIHALCFSGSNAEERMNIYHALHPYLKYAQIEAREGILNQLRQLAGMNKCGRKTHRLLTTDEINQLGESPAAIIGAHTHNHPALSVLSYKEQTEEIRQSRKILENAIDKKIDHFSYPYGNKKDYNQDSLLACRELGFKIVCANYYGQAHSWTDVFQIPRILIRNWNRKDFKNHISKSFSY